MKTKREWKRSKRGNLYLKHAGGMLIVFERSDGKGFGLMRTAYGGDGEPTFCSRSFDTEEEALEGVDEFIDDLKNTVSETY
jgi:hypothetical protein